MFRNMVRLKRRSTAAELYTQRLLPSRILLSPPAHEFYTEIRILGFKFLLFPNIGGQLAQSQVYREEGVDVDKTSKNRLATCAASSLSPSTA